MSARSGAAVEDLIARIWENLVGRVHGPLTFRLLLQPAMAIFFAVRAGLHDARENRAPYFWALIYDPAHRREILHQGWKDVGKIFVLAVILDVMYQLIVFRWVYPGETVIVATVLALVPYLLIRGPVTRIRRRRRPMRETSSQDGTRP
jgi:hypothetical protein